MLCHAPDYSPHCNLNCYALFEEAVYLMQARLFGFIFLLLLAVPCVGAEREQLLLSLHGSNTIGAELAPALVQAWLRTQGYRSIKRQAGAPQETRISALNAQGQPVAVRIFAHGSSTGFIALAARQADIGLSSRSIKPAEVLALREFGDMSSFKNEYVLGLDGIAVIVHPSNPLKSLDKGAVRKLFTGQISDWAQLGGKPGPVRVYARDDQSGTYDTFKSLVLGKKTPLSAGAKRFESNAKLSDAVAADVQGIGFVALPFVRKSRALALSDGEAGSITPQGFSVATEDYALARRLFMYVPQGDDKPMARAFAEFAVSESGQQVVERVGFVSQSILESTTSGGRGVSAEYKHVLRGAHRLSLNFRFRRGEVTPDSKAQRDLERLVNYLALPHNRGRKISLLGFADSNESLPMYSLELSIARADAIANLLLKRGVGPRHVRGFGQASPVASNETSAGRFKNRRVEVWLD